MARGKDLQDWVKLAKSPTQIERIEAFFGGHGYELHRHDTYAIGRTLSGVQCFNYCGGMRHSLPGGTMVLHPDEPESAFPWKGAFIVCSGRYQRISLCCSR